MLDVQAQSSRTWRVVRTPVWVVPSPVLNSGNTLDFGLRLSLDVYACDVRHQYGSAGSELALVVCGTWRSRLEVKK